MKKNTIPINTINILVIISIMAVVTILTGNVIDELTLRDIQNVTKLVETNIYSELTREIVEPINTSMVMAKNTLLLDIMDKDNEETEVIMAKYLTAIQRLTGYDSVFLVSHSTLSYYHPGGTDAKVDLDSDSSFWYTNAMEAQGGYSAIVNNEQLDNWALYMYVDAKIYDDEDNYIGMTGVGTKLTHLQKILGKYMDDHQVDAYIIDGQGDIQVHQKNEMILNTNVFDYENGKEGDLSFSHQTYFQTQIGNRYLVIEHIPSLDWYLVVTKETSDFTPALQTYRMELYIVLGLAVLAMMIASTIAINRYKIQIVYLSNMDHLTNLPNRKIFEDKLGESIKRASDKYFCLALFDLDDLKKINDSYGHDVGDKALKVVCQIAKEFIDGEDLLTRVGGDEFGLVIYDDIEGVLNKVNPMLKAISDYPDMMPVKLSVSMGITPFVDGDTNKDIYKRADKALYESKEKGKNQVCIF